MSICYDEYFIDIKIYYQVMQWSTFIKPTVDKPTCLLNPFEQIFLKLVEKTSHPALLCLAFDDLMQCYAAGSFRQRSFICVVIDWQDKWCTVDFIFGNF